METSIDPRDITEDSDDVDPFKEHQAPTIADKQVGYHAPDRRSQQIYTPARHDPFSDPSATPDARTRSYKDIMKEHSLLKEQALLREKLDKKRKLQKNEEEKNIMLSNLEKKAKQIDDVDEEMLKPSDETPIHALQVDSTPLAFRGGPETPTATRSRWDETPRVSSADETPIHLGGSSMSTPLASKRSRWDETPVQRQVDSMQTPSLTPKAFTGAVGETPRTGVGVQFAPTPTPSHQIRIPMTPAQLVQQRAEQEIAERNRWLSDAELDTMFPQEGYEIIEPPPGYAVSQSQKVTASPTPAGQTPVYQIPVEQPQQSYDIPIPIQDSSDSPLPSLKPHDYQFFEELMKEVDESLLTTAQLKDREMLKLLLKVKNGYPPQRKSALRRLTEKARWFGPTCIFDRLLPLLMSPTLDDQERHLLVKVVDRVLFHLDDLIRPYVHKILVVIEPLLIDEDYYSRVEGREIISNVAKAAGLATMIATMRPDIDNPDEYVRNTTARAFSVVASSLGIPALLPFLKAVCMSKKSWQARHTGIKIVQQIAILMGCAILPHLKALVELIENGLNDEQTKVKTITALAISALAEAATPYGIESFDSILRPLWKGIQQHHWKTLAAFLKATGYIIPLMDASYANYYTREVMPIVIREFSSQDDEMKKIVLRVVRQSVSTEGVEAEYVRTEIMPEFFRAFWIRRMALDRRNYRQVVDTTVELANKVGGAGIIQRMVEDLKDEAESYRRMVMETIEKILSSIGATDIDQRLEELLIDGILYAFQEQQAQTTHDEQVMLNAFGTIVNVLGERMKPYFPQIAGIIKWRLHNKASRVRQQAADVIQRICPVVKQCGEEKLLGHLGVVLYENLGEEYPEALGSILGGLKGIVNVIGMERMTPPIKDLLPRLTPILKNRHEKVQENCIDLVGRIADRGAEFVGVKEWMRICFQLLELLKAISKSIRRSAINTFGYIAKAIGPHDVLTTLLNNLKVQDHQNRVCTTVAIAIVAETCSPFTVLPALMNEYRVQELNVQNGVLKSLAFLFEYIGEMGKDYIYPVVTLLEDALMDRDLVHRQMGSMCVKHMAMGSVGLGYEDAFLHLLNFVWPNVFETSPHVIQAVLEAVEALRYTLGPGIMLSYVLQGLFHPSRTVRTVFWKVYNTNYISAQDALVPYFPRISDDEDHHYINSHLEIFL